MRWSERESSLGEPLLGRPDRGEAEAPLFL